CVLIDPGYHGGATDLYSLVPVASLLPGPRQQAGSLLLRWKRGFHGTNARRDDPVEWLARQRPLPITGHGRGTAAPAQHPPDLHRRPVVADPGLLPGGRGLALGADAAHRPPSRGGRA